MTSVADFLGYIINPPPGDGSLSAFGDQLRQGVNEPVNVKAYGARGDGVTDDTAAITRAAATNGPVKFPRGTYIFNPSGSTPLQGLANPAFIGEDKANTIIQIGDGGYFVDDSTAWLSAHIARLTFTGNLPAGFFRSTFTGVNVHNPKVFDDCVFQNHQVSAVSSNASDEPYWKFGNCRFWSLNPTTAFDVALAGHADSCEFLSTAFTGARVNVKLRSGCTVKFTDCDFIPWNAQSGGVQRARVWLVPDSQTGVSGPTFKGTKFGNESIGVGDFHILVAGELAGTWVGDMQPDLVTAQAGFIENIVIDKTCNFDGAGVTGGGQAPPPIYTLAPDLRGLSLAASFAGTRPTYAAVQFATPPTTASTATVIDTWQLGPFSYQDVAPVPMPIYTNAGALIGRALDPITTEVDPVAPNQGPGDIFDFSNRGIPVTTSFSTTNATIAGITDSGGGANAITITATANNGLAFGSGTAPTIGKPMFLEFDLQQGGASPVSSVLLVVRNSSTHVYITRSIPVPTGWHRYRFYMPVLEAPGATTVLFQIATNGGTVNVGRVALYQARAPVAVEPGFPIATTTTTAPGAGGGGALPATPAGYATVTINGTKRQIAFY